MVLPNWFVKTKPLAKKAVAVVKNEKVKIIPKRFNKIYFQWMENILDWTIPLLPKSKPVHMLGIGAVEDLFNCIEKGADMFDCAAPTKWARRGHLYTSPNAGGNRRNKFRINIDNAEFREDKNPIDRSCTCLTCRNHSRAYLHHLFKTNEPLGMRLATLHNLKFYLDLMSKIRETIKNGYL